MNLHRVFYAGVPDAARLDEEDEEELDEDAEGSEEDDTE